MRISNLLLAALAVLGLTTGVARMAMAETLENVADAYVQRSNLGNGADTNYGALNKTYVKFDGGNIVNKSYHRFDLSTVTADKTSAAFEITQALTYGAPGGQPALWTTLVYALDDGDPDEIWDESLITYNNAPANQNSSGTGGFPATEFFDSTATFVGSFDFDVFAPEGTVYSFSTPALLAAVNGDTDNNLTLMLRTSIVSGGGQHLASKEHLTHQGARLVLGEESVRTWANDASGDWNSNTNWLNGPAPNANIDGAIFGSAITSPETVFTDSAVTVESIQFGVLDDSGATQSYAIAGQGSVNLDSNASTPSIDVIDGTHQFQTVVNLLGPTNVSVAASSSLALNNVLSLNGNTLTKTGAGTLSINNQLSGGGGSISAIAGVIGGSGMIASDLNNEGATVAPGNSPGMLSVGGNYSQTSGLLSIEIGGTNDGSVAGVREFDLLNVIDDLTISGGSLVVTLINGFVPTLGDTFDILDFASIDLSGATFDLGTPGAGLLWDSSQLAVDGSLAVIAAAVPEPTSASLLIVSLSALALVGRRRK